MHHCDSDFRRLSRIGWFRCFFFDFWFRNAFDFIIFFLTELKIDVEIIRSSTIPRKVNTTKQDVLVDICRAIGANTYLSPAGSANYLQNAALFEESGIKLTFHSYKHPTYEQRGKSFIPQLSTLDLLFNNGPHSIEIIRSGRSSWHLLV